MLVGIGDQMRTDITQEHIIQSNLIEGVPDLGEVPKGIVAWNYLSSSQRLDLDVIRGVHRTLMRRLLPDREVGVWRRSNVVVGGRACPQYDAVPALMEEFIQYYDVFGPQSLDPRGMHVKFEHIHPFIDGNGRTGRMIMWWHEVQLDRTPTLITYDEREKYYDWFQ
jgi:Fic family protein